MPAEKMRVEAARTGIGFYLKTFFFFPVVFCLKLKGTVGNCRSIQR